MSEEWNPWFAWFMDLLQFFLTFGITALVTVRVINRYEEKRARQGRARQPQDTLEKLLHTDVTSQKYAEQLWWKFTTYYLPAKRLDIQRRRGLVSSGNAAHTDAELLDGE